MPTLRDWIVSNRQQLTGPVLSYFAGVSPERFVSDTGYRQGIINSSPLSPQLKSSLSATFAPRQLDLTRRPISALEIRPVAKPDAIYESTLTGNRSDSARKIVSERTQTPVDQLVYGPQSPFGVLGTSIVGGGLAAAGLIGAPQVTVPIVGNMLLQEGLRRHDEAFDTNYQESVNSVLEALGPAAPHLAPHIDSVLNDAIPALSGKLKAASFGVARSIYERPRRVPVYNQDGTVGYATSKVLHPSRTQYGNIAEQGVTRVVPYVGQAVQPNTSVNAIAALSGNLKAVGFSSETSVPLAPEPAQSAYSSYSSAVRELESLLNTYGPSVEPYKAAVLSPLNSVSQNTLNYYEHAANTLKSYVPLLANNVAYTAEAGTDAGKYIQATNDLYQIVDKLDAAYNGMAPVTKPVKLTANNVIYADEALPKGPINRIHEEALNRIRDILGVEPQVIDGNDAETFLDFNRYPKKARWFTEEGTPNFPGPTLSENIDNLFVDPEPVKGAFNSWVGGGYTKIQSSSQGNELDNHSRTEFEYIVDGLNKTRDAGLTYDGPMIRIENIPIKRLEGLLKNYKTGNPHNVPTIFTGAYTPSSDFIYNKMFLNAGYNVPRDRVPAIYEVENSRPVILGKFDSSLIGESEVTLPPGDFNVNNVAVLRYKDYYGNTAERLYVKMQRLAGLLGPAAPLGIVKNNSDKGRR